MTDLMKAALMDGARQSAKCWKKRLALETDAAWHQIALNVALEDAVSIAASKLGVSMWSDTSWEINGRPYDVCLEGWEALKQALEETPMFVVGERFVDDDGRCARVIRVEHLKGWDRVTVAFPGHDLSGPAEFIAKSLRRDSFVER